jgi:hypothetical protein
MSWSQLIAIKREAAAIFKEDAAKPIVECPYDGEPLVSARGWLHCPWGNFRVRAGTTKAQVGT